MTVADDLDETIEETFPASDAPGNTPETGIRIDPTPEPSPPEPSKEAARPSQDTASGHRSQVTPTGRNDD
jgi:hypothetical protein